MLCDENLIEKQAKWRVSPLASRQDRAIRCPQALKGQSLPVTVNGNVMLD